MELVEIRNNLIKLSYDKEENPVLGHFITVVSGNKSYVAQFVNIKVDYNGSFVIAKLLFTFSNDGIVDAYDGSAPDTDSKISNLQTSELLSLLPINNPVKFGKIAQQEDMLNLDKSIFEHNLVIFSERNDESATVVSNCVRQLFQMKEKNVIIDTTGTFNSFPKVIPGKDFKLPLNPDMIDYIFENELSGVDMATKAIIQDIFYDVSKYIKTLNYEFLPINNFIEVVADQYKQTQMPELALLKNKLLKYRDAEIFANDYNEISALKTILQTKNLILFDIKDFSESFQNTITTYLHKTMDNIAESTFLFVFLNDENSDKKLLKRLLNNTHVLTTIIANHSYKYAEDLKEFAQNMIFFAPKSLQHDFASYNTFLSKLNYGECIVYGRLTQGIPFIIDVEEMDLDLTQEDVFGEKENQKTNDGDDFASFEDNDSFSFTNDDFDTNPFDNKTEKTNEIIVENEDKNNFSNVDSIENILDDDDSEDNIEEFTKEQDNSDFAQLSEQDLDFMDVPQTIENNSESETIDFSETEDSESDDSQIVPVYTTDDNDNYEEIPDDEYVGFSKGDLVNHARYGQGTVEKIIKYGNKTLCSINFENVGRRLLDPSISEFEKV